MPANATSRTRKRTARLSASQPSILSHFAAKSSQDQAVVVLENEPVTDISNANSVAMTKSVPDGAIVVDLEDNQGSTEALDPRFSLPRGLKRRFQDLSLELSNTPSNSQRPRVDTRPLKKGGEFVKRQNTYLAEDLYTSGHAAFQTETAFHNAFTRPNASPQPRNTRKGDEEVIQPDTNTHIRRPSTAVPRGRNTQVIELDDDSATDESDDEIQISGTQQATKTKKPVLIRRVLDPSRKAIHINRLTGPRLKPGTVVEFADGTFMKIHKIYDDKKEGHLLIGYVYTRAKTFGPEMPHQRDSLLWRLTEASNEPDTRIPLSYRSGELVNEVVQKVRTMTGEDQADHGLWRRSIKHVIRIRQLHITNQPYDDVNCLTTSHISQAGTTLAKVEKQGDLTCRWKDVTVHDRYGKWQEQRLERPSEDEIDRHWVDESEVLRETWRGYTPPLKQDTDPILLCDGFCGGGGVSSGAKQAGVFIAIAFDHEGNKIATHQANFPDCQSMVIAAAEFLKIAQKEGWRVDILHLSPPCQPFSSANTTPNMEKNERNTVPLLACSDIIKALRPRVVTVEEAPGIVSRHHPWFYALLEQFTSLGFSLRWSNIKCSEFGVPQLRRRFIIIAAAPGETLPDMPSPTHLPGAVSIATVLDALKRANRESPLTHHNTSILFPRPKPAYDPNTLAKTITCGGGPGNYHPSGLRQYTPREFAALQTFPLRYKFGRTNDGKELSVTELRTQIGNAVPPLVAKAIMESVVRSLRESDRKRSGKVQDEVQNNVIVLD
ncbi:hypothetical protein OHC33_009558 [Knufia fluminis]|uniref:DNA (cytosine-5-)-methyltransferase n=1 Tax=Knufia fluminis TaxID=191047 RepID=A0AAN8I446_9EURO|nr:hypothetical protein OHC33_009558 [Knufia fluminis]